MKFLNLTPHAIIEVLSGRTFPPSGEVARVAATFTPAGEVGGVPLFRRTFGEVTGLPAETLGTVLIVSALVAAANPGRADLVSPGDLVRGADGQPVGCRGFVLA
ncbi:hypothetical protein UFOVP783_101 [uncultured Caudovirales phage]|uniref:Uncharacterized protein n=1 Tax=uncultured Caudovirales phage TaxID=2100421 RepID=A0A6J5NSE6_9CAUD|nr:hypothetical protein UFOVP783_101 [uncultured Caudovirales phage]